MYYCFISLSFFFFYWEFLSSHLLYIWTLFDQTKFIELNTLTINSAWMMAPDILSTTPPRAFLPISGLSSQLWKGMLTNLRVARPWMPSLPVLNVIVCFSSLYLISCTSCVDHNFFSGIQCATNGGSNQIIELGSLKKRIRTRLVINLKMRKKLDASEALILILSRKFYPN